MADGSAGAKMAATARMTKKMTLAETCAEYMPIFCAFFPREQWVDSVAGEGKKFNLWRC